MSRSRLAGSVSARNDLASSSVGTRPAMSTVTRLRNVGSSHTPEGGSRSDTSRSSTSRSMNVRTNVSADGIGVDGVSSGIVARNTVTWL